MLSRLCASLFAVTFMTAALPTPPAAAAPMPTFAEKTAGLVRSDGLVPFYVDRTAGSVLLDVPLDRDLLYVVSLPAGLGSNDVGLDRGEIDEGRVVRFERYGGKVLLVQANTNYRARTNDPDERADVETSFAQSVLFGFAVAAEGDGHVLVDATTFTVRDAYGAIDALKRAGQGTFTFDERRSALDASETKAFPKNTEITSIVTLASDAPGRYVRDVVPTPQAVTLRERQSFVELPDAGFTPRAFDPRAGFFGPQYSDFAQPFDRPLTQRFINRWRLQKRDPAAALSEPVTPLVYYVERGAPEPIRSALIQGASWWNDAFTAAGFKNAFRVELLPEGVDPMDVRYNVIQWVHRATRGYSIGRSVVDPRTGEILKANVTLASLRDRQDYLIGEGLTSPFTHGDEHPAELQALVLARIRQLAAHEVGHTLGLEHNYIANAQGRTSVMGYPQPLVRLRGTKIDVSDAYRDGIGSWDKVAISWGYSEFAAGKNERAALDGIIDGARHRGLTLLTDQDASGNAQPQAHRWNNGSDAVAELNRMMAIRRVALARFGEHAIHTHEPLATIEDVLVPLYLYHRYQSEAAIASLGGQAYTYALRGDGQVPFVPVPAQTQRRALDAVLATVSPEALALPRSVIRSLPPRPAGFAPTRELFSGTTGITFDPLAPSAAAATMTFATIFEPERAARLVTQHALDPALPSYQDALAQCDAHLFAAHARSPYDRAIARTVQSAYIERVMTLAASAPLADVRSQSTFYLTQLAQRLRTQHAADAEDRAANATIASDITRFIARPYPAQTEPTAKPVPPGAPI